MFGTTFLGHQGWLFQSDAACFLVDPLLCEDFGHMHALGYRVFPPRVWDVAKLPKLDAVVLSHEHDDHFDIPSLAKLDRAIPIYLSVRSSIAGRRILETMGFTVHPLVPGEPRAFGDLELIPFTGDHVNVNCRSEWDALPFMVRHKHGSFFTMVDIPITPGHVEWAKAQAAKPGLVSWTNNSIDWSHMAAYLRERTEATQQILMRMGVGHKLIADKWGTPAAMMMCAGGFSFTGEREWFNSRVFCVDGEAVCNFMSTMYKKEKFYSAVPGQTFWLEGNKLKKVDPRTPFLGTQPVDTWPMRIKVPRKQIPDYEPATGRRELAPGELEAIEAGLRDLARALVGGATFRSLYSLLATDAAGKKPTFAFALRDGTRTHVFEYVPSECAFRAWDDPQSCLAGLECWAADMLAVVRAEIGPIALLFGRARVWNAAPGRFKFDVFDELHRISHPLVRPAEVFRAYEAQWKKVVETPVVFHRR